MHDDDDVFTRALERGLIRKEGGRLKMVRAGAPNATPPVALEGIGSEDEQIADALAQLRAGSDENKIRADTIERRLKPVAPETLASQLSDHLQHDHPAEPVVAPEGGGGMVEHYEKLWVQQIAEIAGEESAARIVELAKLNGLFDGYATKAFQERALEYLSGQDTSAKEITALQAQLAEARAPELLSRLAIERATICLDDDTRLRARLAAAERANAGLREGLRTAIQHIEHLAAWISEKQAGYVFEALGEDIPGLRTLIAETAT